MSSEIIESLTVHESSFLNWSDLELRHELGRGQFGVVYLADYAGTTVASKEVFQLSGEYDFAKYFAREVHSLSEARHPNCIQFMGLARDHSCAKNYIITEYLPNGNLSDHWIHNPKCVHFPWRLRVSFAIDIARALAYLHSRDLIHRDLKGQNILVTENKRVKVADFGLARLRAKTADDRKRLSYCGTDAYTAPEIMLCTEFDASADTFSYGVILLELITRRRADLFPRPPELFLGIDTKAVFQYCPKDCPTVLWSIAEHCVDADPKLRPNWRTILSDLALCETDLVVVNSSTLSPIVTTGLSNRERFLLTPSPSVAEGLNAGVSTDPSSFLASSLRRVPRSDDSIQRATPSLPTTIQRSCAPDPPQIVVPHRFTLQNAPSMDKCRLCKKRFGIHRHLVCDDCGFICHKKCVSLVPPSCKPEGALKHSHERYIEDMLRRTHLHTVTGAKKTSSASPCI